MHHACVAIAYIIHGCFIFGLTSATLLVYAWLLYILTFSLTMVNNQE
jgi:hypothetical protein